MPRTSLFALVLICLSAAGTRADTIAYYRFETGPDGATAASIVDSSGNNQSGTIVGGPTYSSDVPVNPIPQTSATNNFSMSFVSSDAGIFNYEFPFQTLTNATLELWLNPTRTVGEEDFIWTSTSAGDQNRFSFHFDLNQQVCLDYRGPSQSGGPADGLGCTGTGTVPFNQWSYVAFVKQDNVYSIYVNSAATGNATTLTSEVTDTSPNLPTSTGWAINGRGVYDPADTCGSTCQFAGLIDEVRLSNTALSPSQFLVSPGFAGAPHFSNCHGQSVAALAHQYGSFAAAVQALGYANEMALQNAITTYCGG